MIKYEIVKNGFNKFKAVKSYYNDYDEKLKVKEAYASDNISVRWRDTLEEAEQDLLLYKKERTVEVVKTYD